MHMLHSADMVNVADIVNLQRINTHGTQKEEENSLPFGIGVISN